MIMYESYTIMYDLSTIIDDHRRIMYESGEENKQKKRPRTKWQSTYQFRDPDSDATLGCREGQPNGRD